MLFSFPFCADRPRSSYYAAPLWEIPQQVENRNRYSICLGQIKKNYSYSRLQLVQRSACLQCTTQQFCSFKSLLWQVVSPHCRFGSTSEIPVASKDRFDWVKFEFPNFLFHRDAPAQSAFTVRTSLWSNCLGHPHCLSGWSCRTLSSCQRYLLEHYLWLQTALNWPTLLHGTGTRWWKIGSLCNNDETVKYEYLIGNKLS